MSITKALKLGEGTAGDKIGPRREGSGQYWLIENIRTIVGSGQY